jgi:hypothetical protein
MKLMQWSYNINIIYYYALEFRYIKAQGYVKSLDGATWLNQKHFILKGFVYCERI